MGPDISNIIEAVKIISDKFPKSQENTADGSKDLDIGKMLEIVGLLSSTFSQRDNEHESKPAPLVPKEETQVLFFEEDLNTPALNTIKHALPYLDQRYQKSLSIVIRLVEIHMILSKTVVETNKTIDYRDLIMVVRPYLLGEYQKKVDAIAGFIEIKEILDKMGGTYNGPGSNVE